MTFVNETETPTKMQGNQRASKAAILSVLIGIGILWFFCLLVAPSPAEPVVIPVTEAPITEAPVTNAQKKRITTSNPGYDAEVAANQRRVSQQERCPHLTAMRTSIFSLSCDICELIPFLEGYTQECDIVAEAGSRLGTSTAVMLNQHPIKYASLEIAVHDQLRTLHGYHSKCADPAVSSNQIVEGDDIKTGLPDTPVEMLFIDTLHNGNQLWKELEVFPKHVTKWLTFHDSHSFRNSDEASHIKRPDVPSYVNNRHGLHAVLAEFLKNHGDEWVEEMNFVHCNGFYVLRRRSFVPTIAPLDARKVDAITKATTAAGVGTAEGALKYLGQNSRGDNVHGLESACRDAYGGMKVILGSRGNPDSLCQNIAFEMGAVGRLGSQFYSKSDTHPIFN